MTDETMKTDGIYVGSELIKNGMKKDQEGKDVKWELWKYKFKNTMEDNFAFGFSSFDTEAESKYTLKQGERFIVTYKESPNKAFPDKPHKNLVSAVAGTLPPEERQPSKAATPAVQFNQKGFDDLVTKYKAKVTNATEYSPIQLLGMYLLSFQKNEFWELYTRCNKALGLEVPKR